MCSYKTIAKPTNGIFRDRSSKFISYAFKVDNEEDVKSALATVKKEHPSANHICYSYRMNPAKDQWRPNDTGM